MRKSCFYHAGCPDGFGAAYSVWRAWGDDGHYIGRSHDDRSVANDYDDAFVVFVDIAPANEELRELAETAAHVLVLDHHVSARTRFDSDLSLHNTLAEAGHRVHFDLSHSGAMLAWQHFHPDREPPALLSYVEDQDLWNWALPRSAEVNAAIGSFPLDFETWDGLAERSASDLAREGLPLVRANRTLVQRALHASSRVLLDGEWVEAINATSNRSAIGHELAKRAAFGRKWGCVYLITGDRVSATLYSIGDVDVSQTATHFGGGGHRNAAGFSVSLRDWLEMTH